MFISRQTHEEFNGMWAELTLEATPGGVDLLLELRVRPTGLLGIAMLLFLSSTFPPVVVRGLMIDWPSHTLAYNMTGTTIGTIAVAALAFVFQLLVRRALREVRRHLKLFDELAAAAGNPSEEVTA